MDQTASSQPTDDGRFAPHRVRSFYVTVEGEDEIRMPPVAFVEDVREGVFLNDKGRFLFRKISHD